MSTIFPYDNRRDVVDAEPSPESEADVLPPASEPTASTPPEEGDVDALRMVGPWLVDLPEKVDKALKREIERQRKKKARDFQISKAHRAIREGKRFVRLINNPDRAEVYIPKQTSTAPPSPNKADTLMRALVSMLFSDPPEAEVPPATMDDTDRDAAEVSERLLQAYGQEQGTSIHGVMEAAGDRAGTYRSSFIYATVNPHGLQTPKQVLAHPNAVDPANPLFDPETGMPTPQPVTKYVTLDGKLSDTPENADVAWQPRVDLCVHTPHSVWVLPKHYEHTETADACMVLVPMTLGQLKARFLPEGEELSADRRKELVSIAWLEDYERYLPMGYTKEDFMEGREDWEEGVPPDHALCLPLLVYHRASAIYPFGAYLVRCGNGKDPFLYRGPWGGNLVDQQGQERWEGFPLPVVQVRFLDDHVNGDPLGVTPLSKLAAMDEIAADQIGAAIEFAGKVNKPRTWIPLGSPIQPEQMARRDIPIPYAADLGLPVMEQFPTYPPIVQWLIEFMFSNMEGEIGMEKPFQGAADPSVRSFKQQHQLVEQSSMRISNVKRNFDRAFVSVCRLILVFYRAYATVPQRLRYLGDDARHKEKSWSRADLRGVSDVTIKRGSGTMIPFSAKRELAMQELELAMKAGDPLAFTRYQRTMGSKVEPILGAQGDKTLARIRGQLDAWAEGPPEELQQQISEAETMVDPMQQQMEAEQAAQAGLPAPPPPGQQMLLQYAQQTIFDPLPADDDPVRAMVRYQELCQFMETDRFRRMSRLPDWQGVLIQEFMRAKTSAGVMTIPEQQAMQAQQAQMQGAEEDSESEAPEQESEG